MAKIKTKPKQGVKAKTEKRELRIARIKQNAMNSDYKAFAPTVRDGYWRDVLRHEEEGKFNSMIKGLEMEWVASIPVTNKVAENLNPDYFNDPFLMAKGAYVNELRSPQYERKNVFGQLKIKTVKEREQELMQNENKMNSLFNNYNDNHRSGYMSPRNSNMFTHTLDHSTNELFETKMKEKYKGATGVSIMSGEINIAEKHKRKNFDREKLPYVGSSIDLSQPDIYRYEVKSNWTRNKPLGHSVTMNQLQNFGTLNTINWEHIDNSQIQLKSKHATLPKKVNSIERVFDSKNKGSSRLNLSNERFNLMMENSLSNTIPYRQHSIEHKPYAVEMPSKVEQYHQKVLPIEAPRRDYKLPSISLSNLLY